MLGLGHDVVDVPAFAEQLGESGSRMRNLFSTRELWQITQRARVKRDGEAVHLAARWAGKEAFLKAWCEAISTLHIRTRLTIFLGRASKYLTIPTACPASCSHPRCDASCGNRWGCRLTGMTNRAKYIFP